LQLVTRNDIKVETEDDISELVINYIELRSKGEPPAETPAETPAVTSGVVVDGLDLSLIG
jgi:hypothetical protein